MQWMACGTLCILACLLFCSIRQMSVQSANSMSRDLNCKGQGWTAELAGQLMRGLRMHSCTPLVGMQRSRLQSRGRASHRGFPGRRRIAHQRLHRRKQPPSTALPATGSGTLHCTACRLRHAAAQPTEPQHCKGFCLANNRDHLFAAHDRDGLLRPTCHTMRCWLPWLSTWSQSTGLRTCDWFYQVWGEAGIIRTSIPQEILPGEHQCAPQGRYQLCSHL